MENEKRPIDANEFVKQLEEEFHGMVSDSELKVYQIISRIEEQPTVDAVEVVHGHWRYYSTTMQECSNCQRHTARHKFKYCPHCGAIMEDKYHESTD